VGAALIRADRQTEKNKVAGACRNYANTLRNKQYLDYFQKHCVFNQTREVRLQIMSSKANSRFTPALREVQNATARVILVA
jgi:hypothetical protein